MTCGIIYKDTDPVSWEVIPPLCISLTHLDEAAYRRSMTESDEDLNRRLLRELEGKNISHYSVLLSAWVETRMERDKTLVTLSAAAIGLLVTILTTVGAQSWVDLLLILISFIGFCICILSSLTIYQLNSLHIENELKNTSSQNLNLEKFDKRSIKAFYFGVIFLVLFGLTNAFLFLIDKEMDMSNETKKMTESSKSSSEIKKHSLDGIGGLKPQGPTNQSEGGGNSSDSQSSSSSLSDKNG